MLEKLYLYYTNDLHSHFDQWSRVAGFLKAAKRKREQKNQACWIMDIGDHVDRVHPIAEAFKGKANVDLMNDIGYDAVTIGNNEGITLARHDLYHLYDQADFQVACANFHSMNGPEPEWLQPIVRFQSSSGIRIGIIGLTAPFNAFYELLGWHISSPFETLARYVHELKQSTDIIVLMSHLGFTEDQEIARKFRDIDVIMGGHTHHLLRTGKTIDHTIITAAGKQCSFVGEVILTWDHEQHRLIEKEAYTKDIIHLEKDLQTEQKLAKLSELADERLGRTVVRLENTLEVDWFKQTEIIEKLTDTLKQWTAADCAMLNAGVLLNEFRAGDITYKDIHRICPHPINPCVVELNGDELLEVIRVSFTKELMELKLNGFGFRGEMIGRMVYSGLAINTAKHQDGHEYVKQVQLDGKTLDSDRTYYVATADTFTFGRLLPEIAKSRLKKYFLPEFLRDLLVMTLQREYTE